MPTEASYTIADLARLTGLNVRTIRYYIAQGLIPASGESGRGAHYGEGHLDRLRLTKRLQAQHLPLSEIRGRLADLTDDEVAGLVDRAQEGSDTPQTSALEYVRGLLGKGRDVASDVRPQSTMVPAPTATPTSAPTAAPTGAPTPPPMPRSPTLMASLAEAAVSFRGARKSMPIATYPALDGDQSGPPAAGTMPRMRDVPARRRSSEPQSLDRSQWERLSLGPNIELHVRRPLGRPEQRRVERLITIARQVLKEDGV